MTASGRSVWAYESPQLGRLSTGSFWISFAGAERIGWEVAVAPTSSAGKIAGWDITSTR